jgi:uncharacterized protein UPF0137
MSETKELATNFLQRVKASSVLPSRGPINSFDAMFAVQELNEKDSRAIEKILVDGYEPGVLSEEVLESNVVELKQITQELKAINTQGGILVGERISKARGIFKNYREQSFRDWLKLTYGSLKTGYNYLSFFDLYVALPEDLKVKLREMPARAAYILASRDAPIERKAEIVENHALEPAKNIITVIQETLGHNNIKKRTKNPVIDQVLHSMKRDVNKLARMKGQLNAGQIHEAKALLEQITKILETCSSATLEIGH